MLSALVRTDTVAQAFRAHERRLWSIAYRLTGSAADADDVVQDAFVRLARRGPQGGAPLEPWLVRVTVNLGLDALRRRKRRGYPGVWLPSPVELNEEPAADSAGARYDLLESATSAFLVALEALSPRRRAALLLCDVFDYSAEEAAEVLGTSAANVRMALSRARRALEGWERDRVAPSASSRAAARKALQEFLACVQAGDRASLEALLAEDVQARGDGGGEFASVPVAVVGRRQVARFFLGLAERFRAAGPSGTELRLLNGMPAAVVRFPGARPPLAPVAVLQCDLDRAGRIVAIRSVLASRKLTALGGAGPGAAAARSGVRPDRE